MHVHFYPLDPYVLRLVHTPHPSVLLLYLALHRLPIQSVDPPTVLPLCLIPLSVLLLCLVHSESKDTIILSPLYFVILSHPPFLALCLLLISLLVSLPLIPIPFMPLAHLMYHLLFLPQCRPFMSTVTYPVFYPHLHTSLLIPSLHLYTPLTLLLHLFPLVLVAPPHLVKLNLFLPLSLIIPFSPLLPSALLISSLHILLLLFPSILLLPFLLSALLLLTFLQWKKAISIQLGVITYPCF